jgi:hypothetical protein
MLKRTRETVRAVAESAGIIAPSVADATRAAESRRAEILAAQSALDAAGEALAAAEDRSAEEPEIARLEAAQASKRLDLERAQRKLESAERRLEAATAAERERGMAEGLKRADAVLAERAEIAEEIGAALEALRAGIARMDATDENLSVLQAAGHVTTHPSFGWGATRTQLGAATEDIISGTTAPRVVPFAEWIESQNSCARIQQNSERAA